jgi:hypothetical protein
MWALEGLMKKAVSEILNQICMTAPEQAST